MHNNVIVRLIAYYTATILIFGALFQAVPSLGQYLAAERARQGARAALEAGSVPAVSVPGAAAPAAGPIGLLDPERSVPILLSIVAALLVALPVVWVYRWTTPARRYNQAFAQTLMVVPIAITLVVFLVKDSLALAFSLAGIVAAVRFRTTLDEPLDAVYLFVVIGTGLAAGVQLLFVAVLASIVFNAVTLTVWGLSVGTRPVVLDGWRIAVAGPGPASPGAPTAAPGPLAGSPAGDAAEPYNMRLRIQATQADAARQFAESYLDAHAKPWCLGEVTTGADGASILEFQLRLKKSADLAAFIKGLEQGDPHVTNVELMRMKAK